jgi:hypothetical protein
MRECRGASCFTRTRNDRSKDDTKRSAILHYLTLQSKYSFSKKEQQWYFPVQEDTDRMGQDASIDERNSK